MMKSCDQEFLHSLDRRLVRSSVWADLRSLLDTKVIKSERLPPPGIQDLTVLTLLEPTAACRLSLWKQDWPCNGEDVVIVLGVRVNPRLLFIIRFSSGDF